MNAKKPKRMIPVPLSVAGVLLCLVLLSTHFTSGMYARYVTRASGGDSAHLAGFRVGASGDEKQPVKIVAGQEPGVYQITVTNTGETAAFFQADVMIDKAFEDKVIAELADADKPEEGREAQQMSFRGELAPGATKTLDVSFDITKLTGEAESDGLDFSNTETNGENGEIPFTVTVTFTQVD
jgi:hypothetical protein